MPRASSPPTRRQVLLGSTAVLLAVPAVGACGSDDPDPRTPDPLVPLARRARQDAADADAVAQAHPDLAPGTTVLAADRRAHADALEAEIRRAAGTDDVPPAAPAPVATPPAPDTGTARNAVLDSLRIAESEAARLVPGSPAHRAALLASLAACCASHQAVL